MTLQEMHDWLWSEFPICGCGYPDSTLDLLRDVLKVIRKRSNDSRTFGLTEWSDNSRALEELIHLKEFPIMAYQYLYTLDHIGLLEHGTDITGSWLTDNGEKILDALLKYSNVEIMDNELDSTLDAQEIDAKTI